MENTIEHLLENQICFLLYASSREMTKKYKPLLEELNITYPQYLVLLLLWEQDKLSVKKIGELLYLDSGTLTPMLKRMEKNGLITRERSVQDERSVTIQLTEKGHSLKQKSCSIPENVMGLAGGSTEVVEKLKTDLQLLLKTLQNL